MKPIRDSKSKLAGLNSSLRLVIGSFTCLILGFSLLAQVNLWVQDGDGSLPGPERVLQKYRGRIGTSLLHEVLDPTLPEDDPRAMWPNLGPAALRDVRRKQILAWVDHGAHEHDWPDVRPIFQSADACIQCHTAGGAADFLPFDSYYQVKRVARLDSGMSLQKLTITAHNHAFGFAVLALLISAMFCFSRVRGWWRHAFILAAFVGPAFDIGGWFLTRAVGSPFQYMVILGGALFGGATTAMALVILAEVTWGARAARGADGGTTSPAPDSAWKGSDE